jgi:hypothetical protein
MTGPGPIIDDASAGDYGLAGAYETSVAFVLASARRSAPSAMRSH